MEHLRLFSGGGPGAFWEEVEEHESLFFSVKNNKRSVHHLGSCYLRDFLSFGSARQRRTKSLSDV